MGASEALEARLRPTKEEIRQRASSIEAALTAVATGVFANNVDAGVYRYIYYLQIQGDGVTSRLVTLAYGGTGTGARTATIFGNLPIAPAQIQPIPQGGFDIESPVIVLVGGENLNASQNAGSGATITVLFWDSLEFSTVT